MLKVVDVDFDYAEKPVLRGVQLTLAPGCLLHLRGKNGSGKTTFLKVLAGVLQPLRGDITYHDRSIFLDLLSFQQQICYVGHKNGISQTLTIRENYRFDGRFCDSPVSFETAARTLLLEGLEDTVCALLSVGQQKRAGLLRLLMSNAAVWLLDEPLVGLDQPSVDGLMAVFKQHLTRGGGIVVTSHQALPLKFDTYQEYVL